MKSFRILITSVFAAGVGLSSSAVAQICDNGYDRTAAGICPIEYQGDADCFNAAEICGFVLDDEQTVEFTPNNLPDGSAADGYIKASIVGNKIQVEDLSGESQYLGREGFEATISRRNGSLIMCGESVVVDQIKAPTNNSNQLPTNLTVCFAKGPCPIPEQNYVNDMCDTYPDTPDFIQAFEIAPTEEKPVNLCGCYGNVAKFCNADQTPTAPGEVVSCFTPGEPLTALDGIAMGTMGTNTCTYEKIGGKRIRVCD